MFSTRSRIIAPNDDTSTGFAGFLLRYVTPQKNRLSKSEKWLNNFETD
jgi:hypothetical protein